MEWMFLNPATMNFVKWLMSLGESMILNRVFGKYQSKYTGKPLLKIKEECK